MGSSGTQSIDSFRQTLDADTLKLVDAARDVVANSHPGLTERLKWNAPSFAIGDEDRITLGIERHGIRIVLHRGAKPRDVANFRFDDADGMAKWPAPDRGVIVFKTLAEFAEGRVALSILCRRWIDQTA